MTDPPGISSNGIRTGHFIFHVWRKEDGPWSWRLRVEAIHTGQWGLFDSMQDAVRFMGEHMAADEDADGEVEEHPSPADFLRVWPDGLSDEPT